MIIEGSKVQLFWNVDDVELSVEMEGCFEIIPGDALVKCTQEEIRVFGERRTPNLLELIQKANEEYNGIFDGG